MDSSLLTGMAAVLGSLAGASASIATTWMTQRNQLIRERTKEEIRRRESLYGEFITETARLTADAFDHTLDRPDTLTNVYALLNRIRLVAPTAVVEAGESCCLHVLKLYSEPNLTIEQISERIREGTHPLRDFATACRAELDQFVLR